MTAKAASPFPWDELLAAAFGHLRWSPETVWRATPRELSLALGLHRGSAAPSLDELAALIRAHPDT